jgi:hypothetical protein
LYLGTNTIENGNPHPTNIDSQMRSIRMMPWSPYKILAWYNSWIENYDCCRETG